MNSPTKAKIVTAVFVIVLIFSSTFFAMQWRRSLKVAYALSTKNTENEKIVSFMSLFVDNMLGSGQAVSFEERFKMENVMREMNNKTLQIQWEKFTNSKTQEESQTNAKELFSMLSREFRR